MCEVPLQVKSRLKHLSGPPSVHRGTSLIRTPPSVGPYRSPEPRVLW